MQAAAHCALGAAGAGRGARSPALRQVWLGHLQLPSSVLATTVYFVTSESPSVAEAASVSAPSTHLCLSLEVNLLSLLFLCLNNLHTLLSNIVTKIGRNFQSSVYTAVDKHA